MNACIYTEHWREALKYGFGPQKKPQVFTEGIVCPQKYKMI